MVLTPRQQMILRKVVELHAGQEFVWGPLVVAGDEVTTVTEVKEVSERGGMAFYVFETR